MNFFSDALVLLVAALHSGFLVLEMFLWQKPVGLKIFRMSREQAASSATLAANQGLYNGFLAAGLFISFFLNSSHAILFRLFFLVCVIIAGIFGAVTVNRRIFFVQALPAILALLLLTFRVS